MKITPFILFLILLFVLVLSILFSNFLPINHKKEGFIAFSQSKQPIDFISIPQYSTSSNTVVKLYDNLFFDTINANLIEVDGAAYVIGGGSGGNTSTNGNTAVSSTSVIDNTGISITGIYVIKRDGTSNAQPYTTVFTDAKKTQVQANNTQESQINNVDSQSNSWIYNTKSQNTDKYQVIYVSWNTNTYIHIIQVKPTAKHISSFLFGSGSIMETSVYSPSQTISAGISKDDTDTNNGKYVIDSLYDPNNNVYQISHTVKYDQSNGNLIIRTQETPEQIMVYNRYGKSITDYLTNKQTNIPNTYFIPWIQSDNANNMVIYMPMAYKTLIIILKLNTGGSDVTFQLGQILRFTQTGMDTDKTKPGQPQPPPYINEDSNINSDYYKWLAYWNTVVNTPYNNYSQDFLLKTQIIPPVCPSCPSCPSMPGGGTCTNCGGQGGSGSVGISSGQSGTVGISSGQSGQGYSQGGHTGQAYVQGGNSNMTAMAPGGVFATNADANTIGGATTIQTLGVVAGTEDIAKTGGGVVSGISKDIAGVAGGAGNIIGGTVDTAGNLLQSAGSGTVGLLKDTGSGAAGLLRDTGSGTASLLRDTGSGAMGLLRDTGRGGVGSGIGGGNGTSSVASGSIGVAGTPGAQIDNYSYYGSLPPRKSTNFMPVTADFSAFSK